VKVPALNNPNVASHLEFVDMDGHGYTVVTADAYAIDTEFVCIVRPIARATKPDGGPLRYASRTVPACGSRARHPSWSSASTRETSKCLSG
jgi:hypothetical protein